MSDHSPVVAQLADDLHSQLRAAELKANEASPSAGREFDGFARAQCCAPLVSCIRSVWTQPSGRGPPAWLANPDHGG